MYPAYIKYLMIEEKANVDKWKMNEKNWSSILINLVYKYFNLFLPNI